MKYTPQPGESLYSIARDHTRHTDYAESIGVHNGIYADVSNVGVPLAYDRYADVAWFGALEIPDAWLQPRADGARVANRVSAGALLMSLALMSFIWHLSK